MIGTSFDAAALLGSILAGRQSLTLSLYHRNVGGARRLIGRVGPTPGKSASGYAASSDLEEGWLFEVQGTVEGYPSAVSQGLIVLGVGLLVTLLLFLLYHELLVSRRRAWSLVAEKTGELEYRALRDPVRLAGPPERQISITASVASPQRAPPRRKTCW